MISAHEVRVVRTLRLAAPTLLTATEIAQRAHVAGRTAREHLHHLVELGVVEAADVFPGPRYKIIEPLTDAGAIYLDKLARTNIDDVPVKATTDDQPHPLPCPSWCELTHHESTHYGALISYQHRGALKVATGDATLNAHDWVGAEGAPRVAPQRVLFAKVADGVVTLTDAERITQALRNAKLTEGKAPE